MPDKAPIWTPRPANHDTGKQACHLHDIPAGALAINQKTGEAFPQGSMLFVDCIEEKCSLWNGETLRCRDVEAREAVAKLPTLIENLTEFLRVSNAGGE